MRTNSARSTGPRRKPAPGDVDIYLLPAVVGGGLGDIEEVLAAGRHLERAGFSLQLYRGTGRPLPRSVGGPFDWPTVTRRSELRRRARAPAALTVSPCWGVSAAPSRPEPFGRGGVWEEECAEIERVYGATRTVHISFEEFARTLTSREETIERYREGGVAWRTIRARSRTTQFAREVRQFHDAFVRFRAFDRRNVLHLYTTFRPRPAFSREFPQAVQCGPLSSGRRSRGQRRPTRGRGGAWVWYASPASSDRLVRAVRAGLSGRARASSLTIHTPRPMPAALDGPEAVPIRTVLGLLPRDAWQREFDAAGMRIVTGSRTLLEALERGGPFLYFNGQMGGRAAHRHRPEKIRALLELGRSHGMDPGLLRDLADFSRGHRIEQIVRRADRNEGPWARFPSLHPLSSGFRAEYAEAAPLVVAVARALAEHPDAALEIVHAVRSGSFGSNGVRTAAG